MLSPFALNLLFVHARKRIAKHPEDKLMLKDIVTAERIFWENGVGRPESL